MLICVSTQHRMDPLNTISVCTNNWCSQCSLSHIFQNSSCVFPCSCFMFIPLALSLSPETLSIFMEAVISTAAAPSLASPQFHWSFPPPLRAPWILQQTVATLGAAYMEMLHSHVAAVVHFLWLMAWELKYIYLPLQIYICFPFWGYHILVIFYKDKIWAFQKCKCLGAKVTLYLKHCGPSEVFGYLCISENVTEFFSLSLGP